MKRIICYTLLILLILTACGEKVTDSSAPDASEPVITDTEIPLGEALDDNEKPFESIIYSEDIVNSFGKEKHISMSKENATINVLGDSISYGSNAGKVYNYSWTSLFKYSVNDSVGTNNHGFVSLLDHSAGPFINEEIHTVTPESGTWNFERPISYVPGFCTYYSPSGTGSTLLFKIDRRADGFKRAINGFYVHYLQLPSAGSFDITINGKKITTINTAGDTNYFAKTAFIQIPDGLDSKLEIRIAKKDAALVAISGISYAESDSGTTLNNYSLPSLALSDIDDNTLKGLCKSDYLILSLGFNDAINNRKLDEFKKKLSVISSACRENGTVLVVADFIWQEDKEDYSTALSDAAAVADGYYIDLRPLANISGTEFLTDHAHPDIFGHRAIARAISYFFSVPFCSEVK